MAFDSSPGQRGITAQEYLLDLDLYAEDVAAESALNTVQTLHDHEFNLFMWSLGPAARAHMGASTLQSKASKP